MDDGKILLVDDEEAIVSSFQSYFDTYNIQTFARPRDALDYIKTNPCSIVISDYKMPQMTGLEFLIEAKKAGTYEYGILLTAYAEKELLETAINENLVQHVIEKPYQLKQLKVLIDQALEYCRKKKESAVQAELIQSRYEAWRKAHSPGHIPIIGTNKGLKAVFQKVKSVAKLPVHVFIHGETGTGKEIIAQTIHNESARADSPFIKLNCAAIPESLFESELFGSVKGAYTGAVKDTPGKIELADGGTLFLDEIGELKPSFQVKLLRVLQEKELYRIGGSKPIKVDFRLITATNKDLELAIENKEFREDLFYRINEFPIELPPLRERKEDIPDLLNHFIGVFCNEFHCSIPKIQDGVLEMLKQQMWTGNIREFSNTVKRAVINLEGETELTLDHFYFLHHACKPTGINYQDAVVNLSGAIISRKMNLKEVEKDIIKAILKKFNENIQQAVENTSIPKDRFYRARS